MSVFNYNLPQGALTGLQIGSKLLSYLNSPSIATGVAGTPLRASVRLDVEKYEEASQAEISSLLLLDIEKGGKQFISDNIAPHPRTWNLSGYISDPTEILGQIAGAIPGVSSVFSGIANTASFASTPYMLTNYILNVQASILWNAFYSRDIVDFYDRNHKKWAVGISNMAISIDPLIRNKLKFSVVLKEIKLYSSLSILNLDNPFTQGLGLGQVSYDAMGTNVSIPGVFS